MREADHRRRVTVTTSAVSSTTASAKRPPPLAGIRILDMTSVMLGPYATQMLGDYGADIIKIEAPEGDTTRKTGPAPEKGMAATFVGANRNKRSIVLDLKQPAGRDALLHLVEGADVLIYSLRPQKIAALGLGPETLRARNRRLIVVGVHGFAEDGPYGGRPAYDDIIQALCGFASLHEMRDGVPAYAPSVIADKTCGLFAAQAVLTALIGRGADGDGMYVEVPMLEAMVNYTLVEHYYGMHFQPALSAPGYARLLTKNRQPYKTADGFICVVPYTDQHWKKFFVEVGRNDLAADSRFIGIAARTQNIDALYALAGEHLRGRTTADWLAAFDRLDIPAAPINKLEDLERDPHLAATKFFVDVDDPAIGRVRMPGAPLRFENTQCPMTMPPRLGEHTVAVLREAGIQQSAIDALLASRAAIQWQASPSSLSDSG